MMLVYGLLFGIGFGFFVQRAGLCFAQGLSALFMGKGRRILTMWFLILIVTTIGFVMLGLKPVGQVRGAGFFNLLSGALFGAGIILSGGCVLGTLRQLGEGNMLYLIVFVSMIPGMFLQVKILDPVLKGLYAIQELNLAQVLPLHPLTIAGVICGIAAFGLVTVNRKEKRG
ncbi:MAG: YeeE/YedE family protein [Candidatus Omnitrophica bacterium]|nr:YeeE/YedE family protein [Candidatus Omnitrophota bacterium]